MQAKTQKGSLVALYYAIVGGLISSLGVLIEESTRASMLMLIVVGPLIEEVFKPIGTIFLLESKPRHIRSQHHIWGLCMVGALIFSLIENLLYIYWYAGGGLTMKYILFRYSVCISIHLTATFVFSLGLAKEFSRMRQNNTKFELENTLPYITAATVIHGGYNLIAYLLSQYNILKF